jgi:hypothetical protein
MRGLAGEGPSVSALEYKLILATEDTAMTRRHPRHPLASALFLMLLVWTAQASATPVLFTDFGANAAGIQTGVDAFRAALGNPNNGNLGSQASGRREINWDGGAATDGTLAVTPFTTFQNTRGATFTTPGIGLTQTPIIGGTVDIVPGGGLEGSLSAINATYATAFATFSPKRLFVPLGSNITDGAFFLPGSGGTVPATVRGFGVVFTDVDLEGSTSLEFFDTHGSSLGIFNAPCGSGPACSSTDGTLSFLGVLFSTEEIARVRITSGNTALGPNDNPGGGVDVVALDDFLYAEPRAVPSPAALTLLGLGLVGVVAQSWLRKRRA